MLKRDEWVFIGGPRHGEKDQVPGNGYMAAGSEPFIYFRQTFFVDHKVYLIGVGRDAEKHLPEEEIEKLIEKYESE